MKSKVIGLVVLICSVSTQATEFKLGRLERYGSNQNSVELGLVSDKSKISGSSTSFENIMSLLALSNRDLHIRILPGLSEEAQREILIYFQANVPEAVAIAKSSKGNLNNPAILPLSKAFPLAVKTTSYYKELESGIAKIGFGTCELSYEKFTFEEGKPWVAELNLACHKNF
jgi:hypothetical protein